MEKLNKKMKIHLGISIALSVLFVLMILFGVLAFAITSEHVVYSRYGGGSYMETGPNILFLIVAIVLYFIFTGLWIFGVVNAYFINKTTGDSTFLLIASIVLPILVMIIATIIERRKGYSQEELDRHAIEVGTSTLGGRDDRQVVVDPANKVYYKRVKGIRQETVANRVANKTSVLLNEGCKIVSVTQFAHAFSIGRNKAATIYYTKPFAK